MPDEIIKELWRIKDAIAKEHGYDMDELIAHLQATSKAKDRQVVDLAAFKKVVEKGAPTDTDKSR